MSELPLFDDVPTPDPLRPHLFDGATIDDTRDQPRLFRQYQVVFRLMSDGQWRTLAEIEAQTGEPQASISARLRDMRKAKFGAHTVNRRYVDKGLWAYQVVIEPCNAK